MMKKTTGYWEIKLHPENSRTFTEGYAMLELAGPEIPWMQIAKFDLFKAPLHSIVAFIDSLPEAAIQAKFTAGFPDGSASIDIRVDELRNGRLVGEGQLIGHPQQRLFTFIKRSING